MGVGEAGVEVTGSVSAFARELPETGLIESFFDMFSTMIDTRKNELLCKDLRSHTCPGRQCYSDAP